MLVIAVDSAGSVTFGGPPGRRMIPGLGASVRPQLLDESFVDEVVQVDEVDVPAGERWHGLRPSART